MNTKRYNLYIARERQKNYMAVLLILGGGCIKYIFMVYWQCLTDYVLIKTRTHNTYNADTCLWVTLCTVTVALTWSHMPNDDHKIFNVVVYGVWVGNSVVAICWILEEISDSFVNGLAYLQSSLLSNIMMATMLLTGQNLKLFMYSFLTKFCEVGNHLKTCSLGKW